MTGSLLITVSCAQVELKNSEWFGSLGRQGAAGFHTLSAGEERLSYAEWQAKWEDLAHPVVCTSAETFADWKSVIEKLCSYNNNCTYADREAAERFFEKLTRRYD